jgi:peroxiredoxin
VAQLRDNIPEVHAAGGEIVVLGNGTPENARWFIEDYKVTMPVVVDPTLASHKIVGARQQNLFEPRSMLRAGAALLSGFRQTKTMGPAMQLGGMFVITPAGEMPFRYLSKFAGDHPDPRDAIKALRAVT